MKYYNANQASRELGISRPKIIKMIREKELKIESKKGVGYRIPESEIKRLAKKLRQQETELDEQFSQDDDAKVLFYTVTQISEELGTTRSRIIRLIKSGRIRANKGKAKRSPYLIPDTQIEKINEAIASEFSNKEQKVGRNTKIKTESQNTTSRHPDKHHDDFIQIQKNISETMHHIALTQEQIASTLARLLEKV